MNENHVNLPINLVRQEGAVLVVALVILVVLTMLGISGIEATKLETRMADNVKKYNAAFQDAEAQLAKVFNQCMGKVTVGEECSSKTIPGITDLGSECTSAGSSGGSLNKIFKLATVTGKSGSSDPNAIEVNLVAGMWSPGAQDNMMAKTTNQKNCNQDEQTCPLSDMVKGEVRKECPTSADESAKRAEDCAKAIVDKILPAVLKEKQEDSPQFVQTCLINEACKTSKSETCFETIKSYITEFPSPSVYIKSCKNDNFDSGVCQSEIRTACQNANKGKSVQVVEDCINQINDYNQPNTPKDDPTPDAGN